MENPFLFLEKRLNHIEDLILNLDRNFGKLKLTETKSERESEYMDATEVAQLARVKLTTVYAYNTRGTIPIWNSETPIIYRRDEIIEWLANGKKLTDRLLKIMEERKLVKSKAGSAKTCFKISYGWVSLNIYSKLGHSIQINNTLYG